MTHILSGLRLNLEPQMVVSLNRETPICSTKHDNPSYRDHPKEGHPNFGTPPAKLTSSPRWIQTLWARCTHHPIIVTIEALY